MASSSTSDKRPLGGKRCVAGGPNRASCANSQHTDGISMHMFPSETKDPQRRRKWMNFVENIDQVLTLPARQFFVRPTSKIRVIIWMLLQLKYLASKGY